MNKETRRPAIILAILLGVVLMLSVSVGVAKEEQLAITAGSPDSSQDIDASQGDKPSQNKYQLKQATATMVQSLDRDELSTFIIRLKDPPVATYKGGVAGFAPTSPSATGAQKLDASSPESLAYEEYLVEQQAQFLEKVNQETGRVVEVSHQYILTINGLAAELTVDEALAIADMPEVSSVIPDWIETVQTDAGPAWIGAPSIWDGSAIGMATQGEGIVVGVIDTGINMDHPSFADVGDDGYDHTNPRGKFFGWCDPGHDDYDPTLVCNDKLIGVWSGDTDSPEDANGHGSHTASTAAGNVISDSVVYAPTISITFPVISGVAPHANIIAYNIEGTPGSGSASGSVIIAATEQAIADDVDVINYSFGSGGGNPWTNAEHWFSVREAGIFVATSAGNTGPNPDTVGSPGNAPWIMTVGASSHDRMISNVLQNLTGGSTTPPADIQGEGITSGYGPAPIVYAGAIDSNNVGCDLAYPPNKFNGEIVVCDYNSGPQYGGRVNKSINLANAGAGGFILVNNPNYGPALMVDSYALPGMSIPYNQGEALKTWLATGSNHMVSIRGALIESAPGDIMAGFSSRGPNGPLPDVIKPDVTAPGRRIVAAINTTNPSDPPEFDVFQGTSMSSPHVAGAGALIKALHPNWTPAEIQSALMSTGVVSGILKHDGVTQADPFDMGGGRVDLSAAARTGLVLDETPANLWAADPSKGGDPKGLNLASLANAKCVGSCSWTRTVTSTVSSDVTWNIMASSSDGLVISTDPVTFTISAGGSQSISITVDATGATIGDWSFGEVTLAPDGGNGGLAVASEDVNGILLPEVRLPVAIVSSTGNLPDLLTIEARRDSGSHLLADLEAVQITNLKVNTYGLVEGTQQLLNLSQDATRDDPYDNLNDGTTRFFNVSVPAGARRLVAETFDSEAPDMDLFVGTGTIPSAATEVCASTTGTAVEYCNISNPATGTWWILVQNWSESGSPPDHITLSYGVVSGDAGNMNVVGPASNPAQQPFDLRVFWDEEDMEAGDRWYGKFDVGSNASNPGNVGSTDVNLVRIEDDVSKAVDPLAGLPGDVLTYTITVQPNVTNEDLTYTLTDTIPAGLTYVSGSASAPDGTVQVVNDTLTWTGTLTNPADLPATYIMTTSDTDPFCDTGFGGYVNLEDFDIFTQAGVEGDTVAFQVFSSGNPINFYGEDYTGMGITDDGFAIFDLANNYAGSPWAPQSIPDTDKPNNLAAMLWFDGEIFYNGTLNYGISAATVGPNIMIVEYDNIQPLGGSASNMYDFEIVMTREVDNTPGFYEIVFAYDNLQGTLPNPATIGTEDASGVEATALVNNGDPTSEISDGFMVCFDAVVPSPVEITYAVTADEGSLGVYTNEVLSITDNPGAKETGTYASLVVGLPYYMPVINKQ